MTFRYNIATIIIVKHLVIVSTVGVSASAAGETVDIYGACVRGQRRLIEHSVAMFTRRRRRKHSSSVAGAVHCVRRALKAGSASVCICLHDGVARRDGSVDGKEMRGETEERKEGTGRRRDGEMDMRASWHCVTVLI